MRLIDAEKIMVPTSIMHNINGCYMVRVEDMQRIISDQPTAFHKEKVIEKLREKVIEKLKENMGSAKLAQASAGSDLVQSGGFSYGYYNGVKDSIEIVEKGGV